ncbi:MAG TPA: glycosyltransferase [Usitatibacter sp.]|jgi:GT2 family glycosyltransferase/glycosyltransferase involved in cell wall biosynthesis|nr:glycosyltransferase [Usitatibacter sp.]
MPEPVRPVQLHVIHNLGGGSGKWLADFVAADDERRNLVLRSFSHGTAAGSGLALYGSAGDETPLRTWRFAQPIPAVLVHHEEYRAALGEILRDFNVAGLVVSSVIGHSLDVLDTGLPTLVVLHDYFPYCPAINLYFDSKCARCDNHRVGECEEGNPEYNPFADFPSSVRLAVRERFVEQVHRPNVKVVAPSASVGANLRQLDRRFDDVEFHVVPHGYAKPIAPIERRPGSANDRLRILVLGQLSVAKGLDLLRGALPAITSFADVFLVGAREVGTIFQYSPGVQVVSEYAPDELAVHVAQISPHVGLLASIVPETFNYALSELWMMGIPPVASRVGALAERIRDGVDGFLFEPEVHAMVAALRRVDGDRRELARVQENIRSWRPETARSMVANYHRLLPLAARGEGTAPMERKDDVHSGDVMLAGMWKQVKSLSLQLALANESRHRSEMQRMADARRLDEERRRSDNLAQQIADRDALIQQQDRNMQALVAQRDAKAQQVEELLRSTSWRVTGPLRAASRAAQKVGVLGRVVVATARQPGDISTRIKRLRGAWRTGGLLEVKRTLMGMQVPEPRPEATWDQYLATFRSEVRPRIVEAITRLTRRPVVSVIVPTYNTEERVLREMLDSVRGQLYPDWELCVVDDASPNPAVRAVLEQYARDDARIKVRVLEANEGVSRASNAALAMATGEFTVLLDHDDVLEEHALFRVAQAIVDDDPDFIYSDEVLVAADGREALRFAFRPAFSPEYLRSHPYIVHLAGFRTQLLRDIGGFSEELAISQDYDLILRATEKAKAIVHIPEILYRWRIHEQSAGTAKMGQVMETSRAVLRGHLERSGLAGTVHAGESFNLFDTRYPVREGLRVAIIIPTKNHGEVLRQCIESLLATVKGVDYDIIVVDHDSDEPDTLDYLRAISGHAARIVKHSGPFNFSVINNRAVAAIADVPYTHYLFCNNDIEAIREGWLERMLELGQQPDVGAVGALLFYPDGKTIQHAGVCVGMFGAAEHYAKRLRFPEERVEPGFGELLSVNHEVAAVTAACMLVSREAFDEVGGFDEKIAVGFGDVDLCLRIGETRRRIVFCPHARLLHHESFTRGTSTSDPHPEDSALYRMKWRNILRAGDPFFHPALSLWHPTWTLKHPLPASFEIRRRVTKIDPDRRERWVP